MFRLAAPPVVFAMCWLLAACSALVSTPPPTPATVNLAPLLAERRYSEALTLLENAAASQPTDPTSLIQMGQIYLRQRRWLPAEDAFNRALARDPNNALATAGLAEAKQQQGNWPQALNLWQAAAGQNPQLPGVFSGLGRTLLARLEFEAAREAFAAQLEHQPDPEALWYLAALEAPLDVSAANQHLLEIPADAPPDVLARRDYLLAALVPFTAASPPGEVAQGVGISLAQAGLWPLAINALQTAQAVADPAAPPPEQAKTLAFLAHARAQARQPALDLFEQAMRLDPDSALPIYFYGIYLRQQNALKSARQHFQQAIQLDPDNAAILAELAQTSAEQGNFAAAEDFYRQAVEASGSSPELLLLQVAFHGGRGYRVAEAGIPAAEALLAGDEENAPGHDWLGWMYFLTGQPELAEESFRRALELEPNLISARYHLARLLQANRQPVSAAEEYRRVVDWDTTGLYRDRALTALAELGE